MANAFHFDEIAQVRQIGKLVELMNEAGIDFWLSGGWAVDFHLGRVTRPHSDIDFIVNLNDKSRLWDLLDGEGAALIRSDEAGSVESFELDNGEIEITYVAEDGKGRYLTPGMNRGLTQKVPSQKRPDARRDHSPSRLRRRTTRHEGRLEENLGEKPRPHDLADIEALRDLLGSN